MMKYVLLFLILNMGAHISICQETMSIPEKLIWEPILKNRSIFSNSKISTMVENENKILEPLIIWKFNDKGKIIKEIDNTTSSFSAGSFYQTKVTKREITYEYNEQELIIRRVHQSIRDSNLEIEEYLYDHKNNKINSISWIILALDSTEYLNRKEFYYNDEEQVVKECLISTMNRNSLKSRSENCIEKNYNSIGNLELEIESDKYSLIRNGKTVKDKNKIWTEVRYQYDNNERLQKISRVSYENQIEYYSLEIKYEGGRIVSMIEKRPESNIPRLMNYSILYDHDGKIIELKQNDLIKKFHYEKVE